MADKGPRARPILRRWLPLAAACVFLAVLAYFDQRLKAGPPPQFVPPNAQWTCAAADLPGFWHALSQTAAGAAAAEELALPLHQFTLGVRQATGIRPTPGRWKVWFGQRVIAAQNAEAWGICVRPGLLVRLADRVFGAADDATGVRRLNAFYYAWRDGCLIIGSSVTYVQSALEAPAQDWRPLASDALRVTHTVAPVWQIEISADEGLPFHASLPVDFTAESTDLALLHGWPDTPLAVISAGNGQALQDAGAWVSDFSGLRAWWTGADPAWRARLLDGWQLNGFAELLDGAEDEASVALLGLDLKESMPVPEMALAWRNPDRAAGMSLGEQLEAIPHEWNGHRGWMAPYLYNALTPCWSVGDSVALLTSREPVMARLAGEVHSGEVVQGAIAFRMDWAAAATQSSALLMKALRLDLLPGFDERELTQAVQPWLTLAGRLGAVQWVATTQRGHLEIDGHLALEAEQ